VNPGKILKNQGFIPKIGGKLMLDFRERWGNWEKIRVIWEITLTFNSFQGLLTIPLPGSPGSPRSPGS